ncbi:hypothetical protein ACRBEV_32995 (plasmid) [Methylobacterium phyllosphaerae]
MDVVCAAKGVAVGLLAFILFVCPWLGLAILARHGRRAVDLILPVLFMGGSLCACYAVMRTRHF